MKAGYRPDRTLSSIVSDERLFSDLGNRDYEQEPHVLQRSRERIKLFKNKLRTFGHFWTYFGYLPQIPDIRF